MKKIGLICLALVLAMGALGVAYAGWTDTVTVSGPVTTGEVCLDWSQVSNIDGCPHGPDASGNWTTGNRDYNLDLANWDHTKPWIRPTIQVDKNVGCTGVVIEQPDKDKLLVTIYNGYPLYYVDLQVHLHNCGTIPVKVTDIVITPVNFTLADKAWTPHTTAGPVWVGVANGIGTQLEPCDTKVASLEVVVQQSAAQNAGQSGGPPAYQFTVTWTAIQWNEY